jgi:hypothetical protein
MMARIAAFSLSIIATLVAGCASRQEITRLETDKIRAVCIVEHPAVQTTTLDVIKEGMTRHGMNVRVIKGTYENKHNSWIPSYAKAEATGCEALLFYVANWHWDLAYYMRFANIWMTDSTGSRRIAQATYDASRNIGVGKFIVARDKLLELIDQMLAGAIPIAAAPVSGTPASSLATTGPRPSDVKARLTHLDELRKQGLVSDEEYVTKRRAILESL